MDFDLQEWMPVLLRGLVLTVFLTLVSFAVALVLGLLLGVARLDRRRRFLYWPATALVELIRGTPLILQLYYLFFVLPLVGVRLDPIPTAIVGLGVNYGCYLSEVYRAGIVAVDKGQWEASAALGLPTRITLSHIILPQAIRIVIPPLGGYFIGLFKDTALVSTISVTELLFTGRLLASQNFRYFEIYTIIFVLYFAVSFPSSLLIKRLEKSLRYEER